MTASSPINIPSLHRLLTKTGFRNIHIWTTIRDADRLFTASQASCRAGQYAWGSRFRLVSWEKHSNSWNTSLSL
jgi:hypothetical protein